MKPIYLLPMLMAAMTATAVVPVADVGINEPGVSLMSTGHWVKIKVKKDGVYALTHEQLRELGFNDPEKVRVFGYEPTVLLTHNHKLIPSDMADVYCMHESGQLLFYAKGNVDVTRELWPAGAYTTANRTIEHNIHASSDGATYFLSDAGEAVTMTVPTINAPEAEEAAVARSTHEALIYHEEDVENLSDGGIWFCGPIINKTTPPQELTLTVGKAAASLKARSVYTGVMLCSSSKETNYLRVSYSEPVLSETHNNQYGGYHSTAPVDSHMIFSRFLKYQTIGLPEEAKGKEYTFKASVTLNPEGLNLVKGNCGLDYFAFLYERENNLSQEAQMTMYFHNPAKEERFELSGMERGAWHVLNIDSASTVREHMLVAAENGIRTGLLPKSTAKTPNTVVAFRTDTVQPMPEIIGVVDNQNLHGVEAPDLVIVTSKALFGAAQDVAEFHRSTRGLDVEVVDQQQIFNEYSSGNISPEGIRRFLAHLYKKNPAKLKGVLLIGPGTYNNATLVNDAEPYVVTAQSENYPDCQKETHNACADIFYACLGEPTSSGLWKNRVPFYQVFGSGMYITVGRLPFMSPLEVAGYYEKASKYVLDKHSYPAAGNMMLVSDYASRVEDSHMKNAEAVFNAINANSRSKLTVYRVASNLYSTKNNDITRKLMMSGIEHGASFMALFGHGSVSSLITSVGSSDFLFNMISSAAMTTPGRYPIMFVGSCNTGAFDHYNSTVATALLKNTNGGALALVAAGREVYQVSNETLGARFGEAFYTLTDKDWIGAAWRDAVNRVLGVGSSTDANSALFVNTIDYNLLGDPALPYFAADYDVKIDAVNGDSAMLVAGGSNTVSGRILDVDGNVDSEFTGNVLLTVYDTPVQMVNLAPLSSGQKAEAADSVMVDHQILGEYIGKVTNGEFSMTFIGPRSARQGTHRIQAYAYSDDDTRRGLGVVDNLALEQADEPAVNPVEELPSISRFVVGDGSADQYLSGKVMLEASMNIPAGLANAGMAINPVRLTIDGTTHTSTYRLLNHVENCDYTLSYPVSGLGGGRHTASLSVLDANGNWADAELEFVIDNTPAAMLSVAVDDTKAVNFEIESGASSAQAHQLVIEDLSGEPVAVRTQPEFPCVVADLPAGAYRAFLQLHGTGVASSTPKVEFIID